MSNEKLSSQNKHGQANGNFSKRWLVIPYAVLVGIFSGLTACLFNIVLSGMDVLRNSLLVWAHHNPIMGWFVPVIIGMAGTLISLFLVRTYSPDASGGGVAHIKCVLDDKGTLFRKRLLPVKFIATIMALGSGLVLGRAGPAVQSQL